MSKQKQLLSGVLLVLLLTLLVVLIWSWKTYPKVGQSMLSVVAPLEARVYGLQKQHIQVDGIQYHYYAAGDASKPTLLLIHGFSADKNVWPRFAKAFTQNYQVIIPDLVGHGETAYSANLPYDIPAQSERLLRLMDALNIKRYTVMGNSMGGFIAATMALNHPERIQTAVLFDPAGVISPKPSELDIMVKQGQNPFLLQRPEQFKAFYAMTMQKPPYLPQMVLDGIAADYIARRTQLAEIYRQLAGKNLLDTRLKEIKVPTLIIWGAKDRLIDVSAVPVWQQGIANSQVKVFNDLGHMPMLEDPQASADVVQPFLTQHTAKP